MVIYQIYEQTKSADTLQQPVEAPGLQNGSVKSDLISNTITHHLSNKKVKPENIRGRLWTRLYVARIKSVGCNVVGIDVSKDCIEVARKTAENDAWAENRGF